MIHSLFLLLLGLNFNNGVLVIINDNSALFEKLNKESDKHVFREYGIGAQVLRDLGVRKMRLLSHSKREIVGLEGFDLKIVGHKDF